METREEDLGMKMSSLLWTMLNLKSLRNTQVEISNGKQDTDSGTQKPSFIKPQLGIV